MADSRPENDRETIVKDTAREVGFSVVGIADVDPSPESSRVFSRWIQGGKHADMGYLVRRTAPRSFLEDAKSVISVAVGYFSRAKIERNLDAPSAGRGTVSIYAHGRDYHGVLHEMLGELARRLNERFPEMTSRAAVDTEPISERDIALRAGVGWLGKNTCIIASEYGSWVVLGELITNLDLGSDRPLESLCGDCTACVDACPTGALSEPFVLDANRCISYLTIEKRGEIPRRYYKAIGARLFGCDTCQQVCPFNAEVVDSVIFDERDRNPLTDMPLDVLAGIGKKDFLELTRDSAISRCRVDGLRRNALIAKSNISRTSGHG